MRGDFTRDSFNPTKGYTRVLMQQGRVQLDADWNEQTSIFVNAVQAIMRDLIGLHAGPKGSCGFAIIPASDIATSDATAEEQAHLRDILKDPGDFLIGPGTYYVDGIRAFNPDYTRYSHQSTLQRAKPLSATNHPYHLIYLDLWEHSFSALQDSSIREVGLNGADTAVRAGVVWQVRGHEWDAGVTDADFDSVIKDWPSFMQQWQATHRGRLKVRTSALSESDSLEPTTIAPDSAYRGPQNQLYRVEIHHSGTMKEGATFKFSRENASVQFAIKSFADPIMTLSGLGRDGRSSLAPGDWVEISDDDSIFQHISHPLRQVESVDNQRNQVTLKDKGTSTIGTRPERHPVLTRWDHKAGDPKKGGLEIKEGAAIIREGAKTWLKLESGIEIQFEPSDPPQHYRAGDFWLIPARTATGGVEWPQKDDDPIALPPQGIEHHYAPLAIVKFDGTSLALSRPFRLTFSCTTEVA